MGSKKKKNFLKKKGKKQDADFFSRFIDFVEVTGFPLDDVIDYLDGKSELIVKPKAKDKEGKKDKKEKKDKIDKIENKEKNEAKKYVVSIQEIFVNDVEVDAGDADEAVKIAIDNYNDGKYEDIFSKSEIFLKYAYVSSPEEESTDFVEF